METIEGVRLVKQRLPACKTVLGISNVSFGLPTAGREVLNSVFLYHCTQAGLDLALVNAEKLRALRHRSPTRSESWPRTCSTTGAPDPVTPFAAQFRERKPPRKKVAEPPLEERLARYIVEGTRDGLFVDLEAALATADAAPRSSTARS